MRDQAGGTVRLLGRGPRLRGGVRIVDVGLAVELGVIAASGGLGGLLRCLLLGDYGHGHGPAHTTAVVAATTGAVVRFALPVGDPLWRHA